MQISFVVNLVDLLNFNLFKEFILIIIIVVAMQVVHPLLQHTEDNQDNYQKEKCDK